MIIWLKSYDESDLSLIDVIFQTKFDFQVVQYYGFRFLIRVKGFIFWHVKFQITDFLAVMIWLKAMMIPIWA